jgi:hypothetical protein
MKPQWQGQQYGQHEGRWDSSMIAGTTYLSINEGQIRESRDFREIWMFDYHDSQLSVRRQKEKWGWINERKFRKKERTMLRV